MSPDTLIQTLVTSGVIASVISLVLAQLLKKRMKAYETNLLESSAHRVELAKVRMKEYKELSSLIVRCRKHTASIEGGSGSSEVEISELRSAGRQLQEALYNCSLTLFLDQMYNPIHEYKSNVLLLADFLDDEYRQRGLGQVEQPKGLREYVDRLLLDIQQNGESIVNQLALLLPPTHERRDRG